MNKKEKRALRKQRKQEKRQAVRYFVYGRERVVNYDNSPPFVFNAIYDNKAEAISQANNIGEPFEYSLVIKGTNESSFPELITFTYWRRMGDHIWRTMESTVWGRMQSHLRRPPPIDWRRYYQEKKLERGDWRKEGF